MLFSKTVQDYGKRSADICHHAGSRAGGAFYLYLNSMISMVRTLPIRGAVQSTPDLKPYFLNQVLSLVRRSGFGNGLPARMLPGLAPEHLRSRRSALQLHRVFSQAHIGGKVSRAVSRKWRKGLMLKSDLPT